MIEETTKDEAKPPSPSLPEKKGAGLNLKKKKKKSKTNLILVVIIIMAVALFIWAEQNRRDTAQKLEETSRQLREIQESSANNGEEVANEVLEKVSVLIDIPMDPRPTVATINDIDRLKEANKFFEVAKNGDYLILTGSRAVLYDPDRNIVLDVAPFMITKESPTPAAEDETAIDN